MYLYYIRMPNVLLIHATILLLQGNQAVGKPLKGYQNAGCVRIQAERRHAEGLSYLRNVARDYKSKHPFKFFTLSPSGPFDPEFSCSDRHSISSIVGGVKAAPFTMPWMVYLRIDCGGPLWILCSGVVISFQWVLTAAHCMMNDHGFSCVKRIYAVLGTQDLDKCSPNRGFVVVVYNNSIHTLGNSMGRDDIALVKLPYPMYDQPGVHPACLPTKPVVPKYGDICVAAGWGLVEYKTDHASSELKKLDVEVVPCFPFSSGDICTGIPVHRQGTHEDSCSGDSGGPLMCRVNGENTVVGILSFGSRECDASISPAHYVDVKRHLGWIKSILAANSGL